jgi:hypothetical protein
LENVPIYRQKECFAVQKMPYLSMALLIGLLFQLTSAVSVQAAPTFHDPAFASVWNRVDKPVESLSGIGRGYTWGPTVPDTENITSETYNGANRKIQYFDKARMEINNPGGNSSDLFYVTTGLLVKELVTGDRQDSDTTFTHLPPSQVQVAGDPNDGTANTIAPTYASFKSVSTISGAENNRPEAKDALINSRIDKAGVVTTFTPPEQLHNKAYDTVTHHNIADVFVDFGNLRGSVWNGSGYSDDSIFFGNSLYVLGRPLAEPYWTRAVVAGVEKDVLVQLFERRVLTYTPTNPSGFKVEMGNVGQHYYKWRYLLNREVLLTSNAVGTAIAAGQYVFWMDNRNGENLGIYAYDLVKQSSFVVTDKPGGKFFFASDGKTLAWVQTPDQLISTGGSIQGYDLTTGKAFEIKPASALSEFAFLALDNGILYYQDATSNHIGIYALDLTTHQEKLIRSYGQNPVVSNGVMIWSEEQYTGAISPPLRSLHLARLDGSKTDTVITQNNGAFSNYQISGDNVVWSFLPPVPEPDEAAYLYNIKSGTSKLISTKAVSARQPVINGTKVAWVTPPDQNNSLWSIGTYDLISNATSTVVANSNPLLTWSITNSGKLLYSVGSSTPGDKLYLTQLR